jgi:photosystem II stability/assembly factor-like uncharacterized protein
MLKKILFGSLITASLITGLVFVSKQTTSLKKEKNPAAPFERFAEMRAYPDAQFDHRAFEQVLQDAFLQNKNSSSTIAGNWQLEGPSNIGGRITCLAVSPTNSNVVFAGTPGAGLFKTTNGGLSWVPVFDDKPYLYIGAIAIDPNNPNTIYAGTGDPNVPFTVFIGDGIYKSIDGGNSWTNIGLVNTKIISKIIVNPSNSNEIYVSAIGNPIVADNNRGVFKSTNGGVSWSQVLFVNNQTGVSDILLNPSNTSELYAASYTCIRNATVNIRYSNDARIYKTTNAGNSWNILQNGLPNFKVNKYSICMSAQNPNKLYVAVSDSTYSMLAVYKTVNGGTSFANMGNFGIENNYGGFGWYFNELEVSPSNDEHVYISGVELFKSTDGAQSWSLNMPPWWNYDVHADIHAISFVGPGAYYLGTDGGIYFTTDDGNNYSDVDDIPNTQFYRVAYNPHNPGEYWGGAQDNGTTKGNAASVGSWTREFGGDGFQMRFDPVDPNTYYVETQNGGLWVTTNGGMNFDQHNTTITSSDRRNWDMPYVLSKFNPSVQYTGTYRVYKNSSAPLENWVPISGDLTDGLILDARFHNISAIDHSSLNALTIYAGTSDGNVWVSNNDGSSWSNITGNLPDRYVTSVHASPNFSNNVYVTHTGYKYNSYIPHIHKSTNGGLSWVDISGNLPQAGINDVVIFPGNENLLFVATDIGVYATYNGGISWARVGSNMPIISVWDIEYNPVNNRLFAGTYAKSLQSIDVTSITTNVQTYSNRISTDIILFPSVFENEISVKSLSDKRLNSLTVMSSDGKVVMRKTGISDNMIKIELKEINSGLYLFYIESENGTEVKRAVKN